MIVTDLAQITAGAIIARERGIGTPQPRLVVGWIGPSGAHTPGFFTMGHDLETCVQADLADHRSNESVLTLLRDSQGRICDWACSMQLEGWESIARQHGWDWCERYALVPIHLFSPEPSRTPRPLPVVQLDLFGGAA